MKKKLTIAFATLFCAISTTLWFIFSPSHIINSGLTTQRKTLENSEQFTLYSLDPCSIYAIATDNPKEDHEPKPNTTLKEKFHRYTVLGKTRIVDSAIKARLIRALYGGIDEGGSAGIICFNPRHGIRVVRGEQTVDLLICFECQKIYAYTNSSSGRAYTSGSPQKIFDSTLVDAKIPLDNCSNNGNK